ncbi:MAG: major facilitator superfamily 1 [Myxococcales bacterium]|nr:major facilitator superfamily 1 [Myxococcales bacterium]
MIFSYSIVMNTKPWWREPTRAQWAAFAAAWVGWVLDAFDFMVYVLVAKQIAAEFGVSVATVLGSITLPLIVRLGGGSIAGWLADRWGRKFPLLLSLVWFVAFDAAIYFSHSFAAILVFRTLFGLGMGAQWTAGTALAMESLPARTRKIGSGLLQAGWPIGVMLAAAVAYFVVDVHTWRPMFIIGAIPAVLTLPLWFMFPNTRPAAKLAKRSAVGELAAPGVLRMIVLGSLVMALGFIVYYGLQSTYSVMLQTEFHLTPQSAMVHVLLFNAGMLAGVIAAGFVATRYGVIAALVTPALLMVPVLPLYVGMVPGALAFGAFFGGVFGVGYSGVTPVLTTSLFPEHVRARAIGIVYHVGALVGGFVPLVIPQIASATGLPLSRIVMLVVAVALVAMAGAVFLLRHRIAPIEKPAIASSTEWSPSAPVTEAPVAAVELATLEVARSSRPFERVG